MADRTTIVMAHRLSTVERADSIVVMDAGQDRRLVATTRQLLAEGGLYAQALCNRNFPINDAAERGCSDAWYRGAWWLWLLRPVEVAVSLRLRLCAGGL